MIATEGVGGLYNGCWANNIKGIVAVPTTFFFIVTLTLTPTLNPTLNPTLTLTLTLIGGIVAVPTTFLFVEVLKFGFGLGEYQK